jgi:phosphoglycerol transferase MdoB-like AlkP superfamily enzyme
MKNKLRFIAFYALFWMVFFTISRLYFIVINYHFIKKFDLLLILQCFRHGWVMDLSATGYLMLIPGLLLVFFALVRKDFILKALHWYTFVFVGIIALLIVSDAKLYGFWGYRMDSTPLLYLKTPQEAFASVSVGEILINILSAALIAGLFIFIYRRFVIPSAKNFIARWWHSLPLLGITLLLFIPIRGGFGVAPMNTGWVYYCNQNFLNHAAINEFWNLGFSLSEMNDTFERYHFYSEKDAKKLSQPLMQPNEKADTILLKNNRPNVIVLIVESFTANVIEPLGGHAGLTPRFNQLAKEGILFRNFYANGDRSDKGIVAILSGFPSQPSTSIIKYPGKTKSLPRLPLNLKNAGYHTAFYHGGDINFANMRSYLMDSYFDEIISKNDFPSNTWNSKWGAHDHIVLQRLYNDLSKAQQPFFYTCFTLSSHEPFEVPSHFMPGPSQSSKFMNAIYYTDSCIGNFVDKCRTQPWWNNTLIIILADHGHPEPDRLSNYAPRKFHIPMLWIGGVIKQNGTVNKFASQSDLAGTLLNQINLSSQEYTYSRNIFSHSYPSVVQYVFNNGFGQLKDSTDLVFDFGFNKVIQTNILHPDSGVIRGKAFVQRIYNDIESR